MDRLACDRMFVAVMELGSFAAGARYLGTSPGQASKLVSRLENVLGVRLLNRTTRALSATEEGRVYFERIRILLRDIDELDASLSTAFGTLTGLLRITVPTTFGVTQLIPLLNEFARRNHQIELDVAFSDRVVSLVDEGFDAAVRVGKPLDSSMIARRLCDVHIVAVASPAYLKARGVPRLPEHLTEHQCIIDTNLKEPFVWRFRMPTGEITPIPVTGRLRYSNATACLAAAEAGLGIACVPSFIAEASIGSGSVQPLLNDFTDEPYGVYVIYPPGRHLATKVRTFITFLTESFRLCRGWRLAP